MRPETRRRLGPVRRIKWILGTTTLGVRAIAHVQGYGDNLVTNRTDLVLEGFPRSGNSFLMCYMSIYNPDLCIAHHLHMIGQFAIARRFEVPSVLLVRNPVDAVSSLLVADPPLGVERATDWWIYYHRRLIPHRERLLILPFESFIGDPQESVNMVAKFSGLKIDAPDYNQSVRERVRKALVSAPGYHEKKMPNLIAVPTPEKDALKKTIRESVVAQVRREGADELYSLFV